MASEETEQCDNSTSMWTRRQHRANGGGEQLGQQPQLVRLQSGTALRRLRQAAEEDQRRQQVQRLFRTTAEKRSLPSSSERDMEEEEHDSEISEEWPNSQEEGTPSTTGSLSEESLEDGFGPDGVWRIIRTEWLEDSDEEDTNGVAASGGSAAVRGGLVG